MMIEQRLQFRQGSARDFFGDDLIQHGTIADAIGIGDEPRILSDIVARQCATQPNEDVLNSMQGS